MARKRGDDAPPASGSINPEVNPCARLEPLRKFETRARDRKRVRVLIVNERSSARECLAEWDKSSQREFIKVMALLRKIAEHDTLPELATIKRVGTTKELVQVDGHKNARLYCFEDGNDLVVCVSGFWVGRGAKKKMQDKAIAEAEGLMALWRSQGERHP